MANFVSDKEIIKFLFHRNLVNSRSQKNY